MDLLEETAVVLGSQVRVCPCILASRVLRCVDRKALRTRACNLRACFFECVVASMRFRGFAVRVLCSFFCFLFFRSSSALLLSFFPLFCRALAAVAGAHVHRRRRLRCRAAGDEMRYLIYLRSPVHLALLSWLPCDGVGDDWGREARKEGGWRKEKVFSHLYIPFGPKYSGANGLAVWAFQGRLYGQGLVQFTIQPLTRGRNTLRAAGSLVPFSVAPQERGPAHLSRLNCSSCVFPSALL